MKVSKKIIALVLTALMAFTSLPVTAFSAENGEETAPLLGTVTGITEGIVTEISGTNVTASIEEAVTLTWSPADMSIGRYMDAWWVGFKITAPESLSTEQIKLAQYYNGRPSNWGTAKSFWANKDSADDADVHFLTFWLPVTLEYIDMFKAAG
ncbi:MAG: hypothetical protein ACI4GC_03640, partial [Acutalibacteraceae bacterium]